jgi:type IV pilus assembly protein PilA
MLTIARARLQKDEEDGFTLIELMVVVLIIAILLAIAIPTFLGAQDRARDRGAQSQLRNALMTTVTVSSLVEAEGALTFNGATGVTTANENITLVKTTTGTPAGSDAVLLYTRSASGDWFGIAASRTGQVGYCKGASAASAPGTVTAVGVNATTGALTGCVGPVSFAFGFDTGAAPPARTSALAVNKAGKVGFCKFDTQTAAANRHDRPGPHGLRRNEVVIDYVSRSLLNLSLRWSVPCGRPHLRSSS